jgi:hypothetical protein
MRKRRKKKLHSCGLCKPHKLAKSNKFEGKLGKLQDLKLFEKEKFNLEGKI